MANNFFVGLSSKIDRILDYLGSKSNLEIGEMFSKQLPNLLISDKESFGSNIKKSFTIIKSKDSVLNDVLKILTDEQKNYFYSISSDAQEIMRGNLRTISAYIEDLNDLYSSSGSVSELYNIDLSFRNSYDTLIHFAQLSTISLNFLKQKISDDLNPSFDSKINRLIT